MTPDQRTAVVAEAYTWMGTPYVHMGRIKGVGVDCAQILIATYSGVGLIEAFVPDTYTHDWYMHRDEDLYLAYLMAHAVKTDDPQPGDISAYRFGRTTSHAGIITEPGYMIHAYRPFGKVDRTELRSLEARHTGYWTLRE